jgi:hypothetical protein
MEPWISFLSALVGASAALLISIIPIRWQRLKFEAEMDFQRRKFEEEVRDRQARLEAEFATELSAETAIRRLLEIHHLRYRSFDIIRHHIGGFDSNALRQMLVRAGAVRFSAADGTEIWALRERVAEDFRLSRWKHPQAPQNKPTPTELFPAAFHDPKQY